MNDLATLIPGPPCKHAEDLYAYTASVTRRSINLFLEGPAGGLRHRCDACRERIVRDLVATMMEGNEFFGHFATADEARKESLGAVIRRAATLELDAILDPEGIEA